MRTGTADLPSKTASALFSLEILARARASSPRPVYHRVGTPRDDIGTGPDAQHHRGRRRRIPRLRLGAPGDRGSLGQRGPTISEVAELLGVAQRNASRHFDRLERLELVLLVSSQQDRRGAFVDPTDSGPEVVDLATGVRLESIGTVLGTMNARDRRRVLAAARHFNRAATASEGNRG